MRVCVYVWLEDVNEGLRSRMFTSVKEFWKLIVAHVSQVHSLERFPRKGMTPQCIMKKLVC
jgi:hypothetical protein